MLAVLSICATILYYSLFPEEKGNEMSKSLFTLLLVIGIILDAVVEIAIILKLVL